MRRLKLILVTIPFILLFAGAISSDATGHQLEELRLIRTASAVLFKAPLGLPSMSVEVFSLKGEKIFHGLSEGNGIMWNLRDQYGRKVPNGIYYYRLTSVEYGGIYHWGKLKKFVVLR